MPPKILPRYVWGRYILSNLFLDTKEHTPKRTPAPNIQKKIHFGTSLFLISIFVRAKYVPTSPIVSSEAPKVLVLPVFRAMGPSIKSVNPQRTYIIKNNVLISLQVNRMTAPTILLEVTIFARCFFKIFTPKNKTDILLVASINL